MFDAFPQIPSTAFGDGSHPTTRLCARAVDYLCRTQAPTSVLDVGTGTGILARIARSHGARFIVGTDIDPAAISAARANAALDAHATEILFCGAAPDAWGPVFELVVANILEAPLRNLAPALLAALTPGGSIVLSGFTPIQVPAVKLAFPQTEATGSTLEGWSLLLLRSAPSQAPAHSGRQKVWTPA